MSGVVRVMMYFRMAEYSPESSLGDGNPTELDLGYVKASLD